jgi:quercetin dioxygenase-like cupin family protein
VSARYTVRRAKDAVYTSPGPLAPDATGATRWRGVGYEDGAVHSDFGISVLEPGGVMPAHVHSFEEQFHVIEGEVVLQTPEATVRLVAGDYGMIPIGVPHQWKNQSGSVAKWADLFSPPAREKYGSDTYRVADLQWGEPIAVDTRDPRTRSFGNITDEHMNPGKQSQELLAVSASMRTALLVYSGITLKMMIDSDLGAHSANMFMVQYEPDGKAGLHDHPLEEVYLILDGEVDATFDGDEYRLVPGDIAWAGVGCVHSFAAVGEPVKWLETQAPQMPARHAYRFARDWEYLSEKLKGDN